jgi:hypothetical protein
MNLRYHFSSYKIGLVSCMTVLEAASVSAINNGILIQVAEYVVPVWSNISDKESDSLNKLHVRFFSR